MSAVRARMEDLQSDLVAAGVKLLLLPANDPASLVVSEDLTASSREQRVPSLWALQAAAPLLLR